MDHHHLIAARSHVSSSRCSATDVSPIDLGVADGGGGCRKGNHGRCPPTSSPPICCAYAFIFIILAAAVEHRFSKYVPLWSAKHWLIGCEAEDEKPEQSVENGYSVIVSAVAEHTAIAVPPPFTFRHWFCGSEFDWHPDVHAESVHTFCVNVEPDGAADVGGAAVDTGNVQVWADPWAASTAIAAAHTVRARMMTKGSGDLEGVKGGLSTHATSQTHNDDRSNHRYGTAPSSFIITHRRPSRDAHPVLHSFATTHCAPG